MIRTTNNLIKRIEWGKDNIDSVYMGSTKIWPTEISGVLMNQLTSNPDDIIQGEVLNEELVKIIDNTHWYLGKLTENGMLICQVGHKVLDLETMQSGDLSKFYNGTDRFSMWNPSNDMSRRWPYGDMFIRFPSFSVIKEVFDENSAQLKWVYGTEMPGWVYVPDNWLIGLSSSEYYNNKIHCHANVHDLWTTFDTWKEKLATMDERYGFMTYWQRCIFTHLYWSIYGTTRDVLSGSPHYFLGIDAFCSSWQEYIDGIVVNNRVPIITRPDGTTRIGHTLPNSSGYISKIYMTSYLDILPKELNGTKDTGYCSQIWTSNLDGCIPRAKGGNNTDSEIIGIGYDRTGFDTTPKAAVRLTYHGKIIETKDVEYFRRVKPINGGVFYNDETGKDEYYNPY